MKTAEELNALKEEVEVLNKKLAELTEEELKHVTGGVLSYRGETNIEASTVSVFSCGAISDAAGSGHGKRAAANTHAATILCVTICDIAPFHLERTIINHATAVLG